MHFDPATPHVCERSVHSQRPRVTLLNDTSCFHHGSHIVVEQIRKLCAAHGLNLWHTVRLGDDWRGEHHRKRLAESDVVLVNGEGTLHHDRRTARVLARCAEFCRQRNLPCFLINSVYQGNGKKMAHFVRQFTFVFVRESRSQRELHNEGIASAVVPDMTMALNCFPQRSRKGILITDSSSNEASMKLHQFYSQTNGVEFANLFKPTFASQKLRMLTAAAMGRLVPQRWFWEWRSRSFMRPQPPFAATSIRKNVHELCRQISSSSLIVTGRFHMVCLAMLARTPFIAVGGNTHKIEGLLADAGLTNRYVSSLSNDIDPAVWSKWHDDELARVEAYLSNARSGVSRMFSRICQSANVPRQWAAFFVKFATPLLPGALVL
jgi:polysaccharide pyruvyl transferase WcaK-like protein